MAKVSLRIYNREIESLIDQGHLDEAVAHCRHILQTFPKHLETYRLLGKAYLEAKRYPEAVDIFNRVLMAVPDDFVSHVGMSIVGDEENKLDDALWHMERAFESQPSNAAIQAELQRLYGRRDGVEPPKIRMTRGALAHMYVQGELYPQAISEIRAVLATDPQRADMQVLLARAFFRGGQKADASDMCSQLLKRYPYSFDANRIMVELLPASERAESTQVYRHRLNELDPYSVFVKESVFRSSEVPDASINLERLEYSGQDVEMGQEWGELGIGAASSSASSQQPEWLKSSLSGLGMDQSSASEYDREAFDQTGGGPAPISDSDSGIPDFLRQAGWTESSGAGEEPASLDSSVDDSLTPADIPDWLKGQMPSDASAEARTEPMHLSAETPDWLGGLGGEQQPAQPESSSEEVPDWLSGLGASQTAEPEPAAGPSDIPDWLSNLSEAESAPAEPQKSAGTSQEASIPDWLSTSPAPEEKEPEPAKPAPASIESLGASSQEQDDAVAWLEMLAAKHGAKPEELVTDPARRSEKPPEWVEQARALAESQPSEQQAAPEATTDETGMWLRDLEEKDAQQAVPASEEQPLVGTGETPDWLSNLESKPVEETQPAAEEPLADADLPDWLSGLDKQPAEEAVEEGPAAAQPTDLPDWLSGMQDKPSASEPQQQDVSDWLSSLDKETPKPREAEMVQQEESFDETPALEPSQGKPATPERTDIPDWLSGLESSSVAGMEEEQEELPLPRLSRAEESIDQADEGGPVPAQPAPSNLPEWLRGLEQPTGEEEPKPTEDVPSWLKGDIEEEEPFDETQGKPRPAPVTPADWHPAEPRPEPPLRKPEPEYEAPQPTPKAIPPLGEPKITPPPPDVRKPAPAPVAPAEKPARPARVKKVESPQVSAAALNEAQSELNRGDIPNALDHFRKLIKKGKHLEETIRHLRDSLYRYPVEVGIWQTLGDAYMRANRLQEALDAYNKAEELLR